MKPENAIYVVTIETIHGGEVFSTYVLGVFKKKHQAQQAGEKEKMLRGKDVFFPTIIKTTMDRNILDRELQKDYSL